MDRFQFEGQQRTARQLAKLYPALSVGRWQSVLESGCHTLRDALAESARLDYAMQAARVRAGRKAARNPQARICVARAQG